MRPPNIVLVLTDHFRRDALGPSTPNLMELAAGGVRFANAYCAAPLCQPSRLSLATGLFPSQHGACGNQSPPIADDLRDDTFMRRLQAAGYCTALVGKHHFLDRYGIGMDVTGDDEEVRRYGFDQVLQVVDDGENLHNDDEYTHYLQSTDRLEEFRRVQQERAWGCGAHPFAADDTADGFIGTNGIRFVQEYDEDRPFYLNLSFIGPHPPFWHPGELHHDPAAMPPALGVPDSEADRVRRAHYMDKCALIDRYVGRLLDVLEERGLRDDTVVVFTADHGENAGDFGIWDKRFFYEMSCGVPLVMAGPGMAGQERLNGPRLSRALVNHLDLYPTLLALAGAEPEADHRRWGRSLLPVLAGAPGAGRDALFAELATAAMVRTGQWKLVFDPEQGGVRQLFNLARDPDELNNLAGVAGYEPVAASLVERLLSHRIRLTQFTHAKEEQRLQRVRIT